MDRRKFVKKGIIAGAAPSVFPLIYQVPEKIKATDQPAKPEWLVEMIQRNDENVENLRKRRINDRNHEQYGGILDAVDMVTAHSVTSFVKSGICSLVCEESRWHRNSTLLSELTGSASSLLKLQHGDGTIDLVITNFHSPPDTAFLVKWLCPAYGILLESGINGREDLLELLQQFLLNAGKSLLVGGIHTPNHRWVVCAALAGLNLLFPNPAYKERAEQWLAEGMDLDGDGQYQEKSSYIYSSLSNRVLINTSRGFDKPELLDYVRKNLEMTFYYLHPNGEIVTEASGRQDNSIIGTLENYYYPYRYLAIMDQNPEFAAACRLIESTAMPKTTGFLQYFLEDKRLWQELPPAGDLPKDFFRNFENSGLIRIRRGEYDASILPGNPVFFTFHQRNAVLQGIRLASAFFGKGQFVADDYRVENGRVTMESNLTGPYFQPFPKDKISGDGVWENMPRNEREQSEVQALKTRIIVSEIEKGFELDILVEGTDHVPLVVELIFRPGGNFSGMEAHDGLENVYFLKKHFGEYSFNGDTIQVGPGIYEHKWVDIRGALPRVNSPTLFLTAFTPFHKKLRVFG